MHITCPHCQNDIEVDQKAAAEEIHCPSCGSSFRLESKLTEDWRPSDSGRMLGRFSLIEKVGGGGFGTVYRAQDPKLDRTVAIKVPRRAAGFNPAEREDCDRFLREARSVAQLRHPAIVPVYEVGEADGQPFLVSEFVDGVTLADRLTARRPTFRQAAELIAAIADALEFAHARGVVHRDIKPSNIMIGNDDTPHVMDFGLAKRDAGEITMTMDGQVLGTPAYMSPEQARGEAHKVDGRSDIYSLGVILYELLTGELPFRGNTRMLLHQVLHDEPRPPRKLNDRIPRDLETICLKAMAKVPGQRYQNAGIMAEDLYRWLRGEAILARPTSQFERAWRWAKRRPATAALLLVTTLAALIAVGGAVSLLDNFQLLEANRQTQRALADEAQQRRLAQAAQAKAESFQYVHHIALAYAGWRDSNLNGAEQLLDDCPPDRRRWEWNYLKRLFHSELRTLYDPKDAPDDLEQGGLTLNAEGTRVATVGARGGILIWDTVTGRVMRRLPGHAGGVTSLAFSPGGSRLASSSQDKTIKLWDAATGELLHTMTGHTDWVMTVVFRPDGAQLASCSTDNTVRLWDVSTGREARPPLRGHTRWIFAVAYSPDGARLASASHDTTVRIWDARTGRELHKLTGHAGLAANVAFSPDGTRFASSGADGIVKVWDAATGRELFHLAAHTGTINCLAFSPDGARLASAGVDQTIRLWDAVSGAALSVYRGPTGAVLFVAFSPDGGRLFSYSADLRVKIWPIGLDQEAQVLRGHRDAIRRVVISPDGSRLATASNDGTARIWDFATGDEIHVLRRQNGYTQCVGFSPDSRFLAAAVKTGSIGIWSVSTGELWETHTPHKDEVLGMDFSPDGQLIASGSADNTVAITETQTGKLRHRLTGHTERVWSVAFSPDGTRLVSGSADRIVMIWDVKSGKCVHKLTGHKHWVRFVAFSPDSQRIVSTGRDGLVILWDASTAAPVATLDIGIQILGAAFHPDGTRLATAGDDQLIRLWDLATMQEVLALRGHTATIYSVAFSPNGDKLISSSIDQTVRIWNARPWNVEAAADTEAISLTKFLFAKPLGKADVIAYLDSSSSLASAVRPAARAWVDHFHEESDPQKYYSAAWPVIRHPFANLFQCQFALAQMNAACERAPDDGQYRIALGVAQYRLGRFQKERYGEDLATLSKCENSQPATLAFLAMTQHHLGHKEQAEAALERLRTLMKKDEWANNSEAQAFLREAETTLEK